jgi:hypothetical protein
MSEQLRVRGPSYEDPLATPPPSWAAAPPADRPRFLPAGRSTRRSRRRIARGQRRRDPMVERVVMRLSTSQPTSPRLGCTPFACLPGPISSWNADTRARCPNRLGCSLRRHRQERLLEHCGQLPTLRQWSAL